MTNWDAVTKQARECHTKQAWEALFDAHGDLLSTTSSSKPLQELFRILRADPQCLQYEPRIWAQLIQGCLASWNLELGREIAEFAKKVPAAVVSIPAAKVYLESSMPTTAREVASRALRLTGLGPSERLQLEMLVTGSYAEEGKRQRAIRQLAQIRPTVESPELGIKERGDFLNAMGRMQFLLGRYLPAAELFYEASKLFRELKDWESATKAIFNTAVCHLNGGTKRSDEAFAMIEECRNLALAANLPGTLAQCEAAYGMDAYHHGDFAGARDHLRHALDYLPISDKSYRRLHILSMLSFTYLAMGRYHLARKFGRQAIDLAALDESPRFKARFQMLDAELQWEDGQIEESQATLETASTSFATHGVHTLEELATVARHQFQSAMLNCKQNPTRLAIDDSLRKNCYNWLDMMQAQGHLLLNQDDYLGADAAFHESLTRGRQTGDRFHEAVGLLGLIQSMLRQRRAGDLNKMVRDLEVVVARLGETPLKTQVMFVHAACAYQAGDFAETERLLRLAQKNPRLSFPDRFVLTGWLATIEGRSSRLTADWQTHLTARATRTFFAPTLEALDERHFKVSDHYVVSLERHPSLAELLHYLLLKSHFSSSMSEIQTQVWKQSLQSQGWQQKIRNTIMRLRDFFPQTMAPIIVHAEQIQLFQAAIQIRPPRREGLDTEHEILRLLQDTAMSSIQLSQRLKVSTATTKRILKRLTDDHEVTAIKDGRHVFYRAAESGRPHN